MQLEKNILEKRAQQSVSSSQQWQSDQSHIWLVVSTPALNTMISVILLLTSSTYSNISTDARSHAIRPSLIIFSGQRARLAGPLTHPAQPTQPEVTKTDSLKISKWLLGFCDTLGFGLGRYIKARLAQQGNRRRLCSNLAEVPPPAAGQGIQDHATK